MNEDIVDQLQDCHDCLLGQAYDRSVFLSVMTEIQQLRAQVEKLTAQVDQEIQNWKLRNRMACKAERKVRLLKSALENSAARFNLMAGVGLVNGADPKTGYAEAMSALRSLSDTSTVGEPK